MTGTNDAGESTEGHTIRTSGGHNTFYEGRASYITETTKDNLDPVASPSHKSSVNAVNDCENPEDEDGTQTNCEDG